MNIELEATQTLIELCSKPRTLEEIDSTDYRSLMQGLLICSRDELQLASLECQVSRPCWGLTSKQRDELEALQHDLQTIRGFYARRLSVILDALVTLPGPAPLFPADSAQPDARK